MQKIFSTFFALTLSTQMFGASKLAPLFDALAKDKSEAGHDGSHAGRDQFYRATTNEFLDRLTPSEEIPALVVALESGNPVVRNMGVRMAAYDYEFAQGRRRLQRAPLATAAAGTDRAIQGAGADSSQAPQ